jgi:hypothetical protein
MNLVGKQNSMQVNFWFSGGLNEFDVERMCKQCLNRCLELIIIYNLSKDLGNRFREYFGDYNLNQLI